MWRKNCYLDNMNWGHSNGKQRVEINGRSEGHERKSTFWKLLVHHDQITDVCTSWSLWLRSWSGWCTNLRCVSCLRVQRIRSRFGTFSQCITMRAINDRHIVRISLCASMSSGMQSVLCYWSRLLLAGSHNRLPTKFKPDRLIQCYYRRHWNLSRQANVSMCFISELKADVVFPSCADQKQAAHVQYGFASFLEGWVRLGGLEVLHPGLIQMIRPSCFSAREEEWLWLRY